MGYKRGDGEQAHTRQQRNSADKGQGKAVAGNLPGKGNGSEHGNLPGPENLLPGIANSALNNMRAIEPRILLDAAALETAYNTSESVSKLAEVLKSGNLPLGHADYGSVFADMKIGENAASLLTAFGVTPDDTSEDWILACLGPGNQPFDSPEARALIEAMDDANAGGQGLSDLLVELNSGGLDRSRPTEILFVDESVEDFETILADVGPGIEIIRISPDADGVEQIARHAQPGSRYGCYHEIPMQVIFPQPAYFPVWLCSKANARAWPDACSGGLHPYSSGKPVSDFICTWR